MEATWPETTYPSLSSPGCLQSPGGLPGRLPCPLPSHTSQLSGTLCPFAPGSVSRPLAPHLAGSPHLHLQSLHLFPPHCGRTPSSGAPAHQDRSPCDDALACGSGWGVLRASLMESRSSPGNPPPTGPKSTDKAGSVLLMTHWVLPAPAPLNVQRLGPGRERDRSPELQGLRAPSPAL